jgi:hypothetical protein
VAPDASECDIIRDCCRFITEGELLVTLPDWMDRRRAGHRYYSHPRWPGVVVVYREREMIGKELIEWGHIISVRVEQPPELVIENAERLHKLRRWLPPNTLGARAVIRRDRRINAAG